MVDDATPAPTTEPSRVAERSTRLRLSLAVRDWADPREFIADLDDESRRQVLNAVARDVHVDPKARPGQWCLKNEVRRRITALVPLPDVVQSVQEAGSDPVAAAIRLMLDPQQQVGQLADHEPDALTSLQTVLSWLPDTVASRGMSDVDALRQKVGLELAARQRKADIHRLSSGAVGQAKLVGEIEDLLLKTPAGPTEDGPPVAFAWGIGGSGKSTLVAEIEARARSRSPPLVVVYLDFDRATLNPMADGALDLAFLAQLSQAGAEPGEAGAAPGEAARSARRGLEGSLGRQQSDRAAAASAGSSSRRSARAKTRLTKSTRSSLESAPAELRSAVAGTMEAFAEGGSPLLLILDSVEAVEAIGLHAMRRLERWAATTGSLAGQPDTRILAAGRRPRVSRETGIAWFEPWKGSVRDFVINPLSDTDREQLLADRGLDDAETRSIAVEAIPGNPVLLRFAAETWKKESGDREQIRADMAQGKVPEAAARRYLDERLVRHMQDPAARPYVVPALAVPRLTQPVIRAILLPVVDLPLPRKVSTTRRTRQIYNAFRGATWLTSERRSGHELLVRPEVRQFSLELAQHVPECTELLAKVHRAAAAWHESRKSGADRAFAFYHRAMTGDAVRIPSSARSRRSFVRVLGEALADLPEPLRRALTGGSGPTEGVDDLYPDRAVTGPYAAMSDQEWVTQFEGTGLRDGLGWQLVESDNAAEALSLYRSRPTRGLQDLPPTAILQALVETADPIENLSTAMEAELTAPPGSRPKADQPWPERLYWIVRALCMADPESTPPVVRQLIRDAVLNTLSGSAAAYRTQYKDLIDIAVIYFLSQPSGGPVVDTIAERLGTSSLPQRVALSRLLRSLPPGEVSTTNEHLLVRQLGDWTTVSVAEYIDYKRSLTSLLSERLSAFEKALSTYENRNVVLNVNNLRREEAIQLLRGLTPEIHRPLRHAFVDAWQPFRSGMALTAPQEIVRNVMEETRQSMSVMPIEFEKLQLGSLIQSDPAVWFGAFVSFADRARVLPQMTDAILRASSQYSANSPMPPPLEKLMRVARVFRRWDQALTDGAGSHYAPHGSAPRP